jgi:uncharacterized peroxidase-related enzyme
MAHIKLSENLPGIRGLMDFRPETALPLNMLANILLRSNNSLSIGDRELIATYVSSLNDCYFCQNIHGAVAAYYLGDDLVKQVKKDVHKSTVSEKMKALLQIAACVQKGGKYVKIATIEAAKKNGATELEIHDTVLISAAFCMFNRYVDGLATFAPTDPNVYKERARKIAEETGYTNSKPY